MQRVGPPYFTLQGLLKMTTTTHDDTHPRAYWSGVLAMTLCAFALVASEFMPVSLLTPVSQDLGISEGMAGQGIAISGALAVLTSLFLSRLAGNLNRKTLLLGLTLLMALSGGVIALAPDYLTYMAGRALIGVAIGGFWSLSTATAIRLVPRHQVPRALAIFNGGNALATVIAAPLGSWLGVVIGWRGAFFCLAPIALFAFIWQWRSLPAMPAQGHNGRAAPAAGDRGHGGLRDFLHGSVRALYLCASVSGNRHPRQCPYAVAHSAWHWHRRVYRHAAD